MGAFPLCVVAYIYNRLVNACILKICDWIDMFMLYVGKRLYCLRFVSFFIDCFNCACRDHSFNRVCRTTSAKGVHSRSILNRGLENICHCKRARKKFVKLLFLYIFNSLLFPKYVLVVFFSCVYD